MHIKSRPCTRSPTIVADGDAALSKSAWNRLDLKDGDTITISHPDPLDSLSQVRSRIYGNGLSESALTAIITDVVDEQYPDVRISSFITACAACPLDHGEVLALTRAMVDAGERLSWNADILLDKHSVGGPPGNADHRADHCRARTTDAKDVLPSYYFSRRHDRHDGSDGARRAGHCRTISLVRAGVGLRGGGPNLIDC